MGPDVGRGPHPFAGPGLANASTSQPSAHAVAAAGCTKFVIVNGRVVCDHGSCAAYQGRISDGTAQLTVPGGHYDILVLRT